MVKSVGKGTYGRVICVDIDGTTYALKLSFSSFPASMIHEANIMRLAHDSPYVMSVNSIAQLWKMNETIQAECNGYIHNYGIVMPVADMNLFELINSSSWKSLSIADREHYSLRMFVDMLLGLAALHHNYVVHSDIKSDNFLVTLPTSDSEDDCVKGCVKSIQLADTGISFHYSEDTRIGGAVYEPHQFIAPELHAGILGYSNDIYSMGCVLYHMITGDYLLTHEYNPDEMTRYQHTTAATTEILNKLSQLKVGNSTRSLLASLVLSTPEARSDVFQVLTHPALIKPYEKHISRELDRIRTIKRQSYTHYELVPQVRSVRVAIGIICDIILGESLFTIAILMHTLRLMMQLDESFACYSSVIILIGTLQVGIQVASNYNAQSVDHVHQLIAKFMPECECPSEVQVNDYIIRLIEHLKFNLYEPTLVDAIHCHLVDENDYDVTEYIETIKQASQDM